MKVCIIGCGAISSTHAAAIEKTDYAELYAVCDIDKAKADAAGEKYGCKVYYNIDDALADKEIDSVHICTPHYLHYEMTVKALNSGKTVICEKPLTMKKNELNALITRNDLNRIYPILQNRFNSCVVAMKKLIEENDFGKLICVKGILTWKRDAAYYAQGEWRGKKATEGGGVLINQSLHTFDLMNYFAGEAVNIKSTKSNKSLEGIIEVEDTVDARIIYKNGAVGIFFATNGYGKDSAMQVEVEYEKAKLVYNDSKLYYNGEYVTRDGECEYGKKYWGSGHILMINDIYQSIAENRRPMITVGDCLDTMNALLSVYEDD